MLKKWVNIFRKTKGNAHNGSLSEELVRYQPLRLPFTGAPSALRNLQANNNLDYILAQIPNRLALLRALLKQTGQAIDWPDDFTSADIDLFVSSLHQWAGEQWASYSRSLPSDAKS
jgi:hypothetical protein